MKLTVWKIRPPDFPYDENDVVYRWTIKSFWYFITSKHEFPTEKSAENSLIRFLKSKFPDYRADKGYLDIIYDERTNLEFIA